MEPHGHVGHVSVRPTKAESVLAVSIERMTRIHGLVEASL